MLIEIDVLVAMSLGLTLEELIELYNIQFPVVKKYENDTWYDQNGRIVFSAKSYGNLTLDRKNFETKLMKENREIVHTYEDDTTKNGVVKKTIIFEAPFIKCNREADYTDAWKEFERRFV